MDQTQSVQSMLLITLGVISLLSALSVGVSQKVMSEISQRIESVIKFLIKVTMKMTQRKVRSGKGGNSASEFLKNARKKTKFQIFKKVLKFKKPQ
eukprot:5922278-Amphidinium_carterae.1